MSGSSLDGLDIAFVYLQEHAGKWQFEIIAADCYAYEPEWQVRLRDATKLSAKEYLLLHSAYGHYLGERVLQFIEAQDLHHRVDFIASHGHTSFHQPAQRMTGQLGDGAALAAVTGLPVISDLRALDVALGGQGAPLVPIGEKYLFSQYELLLNIGGIANLSCKVGDRYLAFDVCPANRVLNSLVQPLGKAYDAEGQLAAAGVVNEALLLQLAALPYYQHAYPKSLDNEFGLEVVLPLIEQTALSVADKLCTYTEHIALQIKNAIQLVMEKEGWSQRPRSLLITGGGALNHFLIARIAAVLKAWQIQVVVPEEPVIHYKEALVMALMGTLRWREENNVLSSVTGASRDSIGGALWMGHAW